MTATWNTDLIECVGTTLGGEMRAIGAHILWPLAVSMHRPQPAGRDLECYSEDPFLTGRMAIAYIDGLQGQGVGASIKHSVCNDFEFEQRTLSSQVAERALRETNLFPLRVAIHQAEPWDAMSAYNKVNGRSCSEDPYLLLDFLKGERAFDGAVIPDWIGTYTPTLPGVAGAFT